MHVTDKKKHHKLNRGLLGDARCQISKLYIFYFQRRRFFKFSSFVPMFKFFTTGPVFTPGALNEQTW